MNKNGFGNAIAQKETLVSKSNGLEVTPSNSLPKSLMQFVETAHEINTKYQKPFCYKDFPNLKESNFRKIIFKLSHEPYNIIERVGKGNPQFYKLRGLKLAGDSHKVTVEGMGVGVDSLINLLSKIKEQPLKIHDIKVKISNNELHDALVCKGSSVNEKNHSIKINFESFDNNVTTKILVYPNTVQIDIGCTYKPLIYDISTVWFLHEHLSKISYHLSWLSGVFLPSVDSWIITHWHFGKDGAEAFNGQNFHYTINDVNTGLIRFYSKSYPDGTAKPRLEQIQTPHTTLRDEMKKAMFEGVF